MKEWKDFVDWITIGNYFEHNSGLYVDWYTFKIKLLNSLYSDFNIEENILDSENCFLKQLNHEILHYVVFEVDGVFTSIKLDDIELRHELIDV